ncbi:MAG: transcriptional regulator [Robiginitomaculum sp.]|nr:MAG: transcriptional regulator [Robiginitomaculum sp.]
MKNNFNIEQRPFIVSYNKDLGLFIMSDNRTQRHMAILRYIPQKPGHTTTVELKNKLSTDGFNVSLRMLQRDIESLSCQHAINCDDSVRPHRWFQLKGVNQTGMTLSTALAICMLKEHAQHLLPAEVNTNLDGFFSQATHKLAASSENPLCNWPAQVAILPPGFQLGKPTVNDQVMKTVEYALIHQQELRINYKPRPPRQNKSYQINPLGLVARGHVVYLIATLRDSGEYRHFVLHRMVDAELSSRSAKLPPHFDLSGYLEKGSMSFPKNEVISLELKVDCIEGFHLLETPLSPEQVVTYPDHDHFIIQAQVNNTEELKWWLMSISDISQLLGPESLKNELAASLIKAAQQYQ